MFKNLNLYKIFEGIISSFFIANLIFYTVNKKIDNPIIPIEFAGYMFWLSLGLYLGYHLARIAFNKALKSK